MKKMKDEELIEYRKSVLQNMTNSEIAAIPLKQKRALLTKRENKGLNSQCSKNYLKYALIFILLIAVCVYMEIKLNVPHYISIAIITTTCGAIFDKDQKNWNVMYTACLMSIRDNFKEQNNFQTK